MSAQGYGAERVPASEMVAGFLAAAVILVSAIYPIAYVLEYPFAPGRVGPGTMLVALVAAGMAGKGQRLPAVSLGVSTAAWLVGMILAVTLELPLF